MDNSNKSKFYINKLDIGDYTFCLNYKGLKNPADLLARLAPLKEEQALSNDEKIAEVRRIVSNFME